MIKPTFPLHRRLRHPMPVPFPHQRYSLYFIHPIPAEEYERLEREAFGGHQDVWIEVDVQQQRVLGDPNMSEETKKALGEMIKAAVEAVKRGDFDDDKEE